MAWVLDYEWVADNFADMHKHEAHRRAWLATVDQGALMDELVEAIGLEYLDECVGTACRRLGYLGPDEEEPPCPHKIGFTINDRDLFVCNDCGEEMR